MVDKEMRYLAVSRCFFQKYNITDPDVIGRSHYDIFPDIPERWRAIHRAALAGETLHCDDDFFQRADGSLHRIRWEIRPWLTISGEVGGIILFSEDIAELKRTEEMLRESQQKLKLFIEGAPTGIAAFDTEMRYLAVSERFLKQFHVVDTDVIGRSHYDIFPEIPERWRDIHRRCIAGETLSSDEDPFHRADGSVDWVRWEIRPWFDVSGEIGGIICFTEDVSERMQYEQELIVLNNQLTHEVAKRTSDLSALTAHIQKIAESERAGIARELHDDTGSVMTALSMRVGLLQGKSSDPDLLHDLAEIRELISNAVQSIRNIVNQLYPTVLDDYGFVQAVNLMVKEYRRHSGIDVEMAMPREDIVMAPDYALAAYRITQECLNNIAKHAGASKVHIEAKVIDGFLYLTISDDGKGMPSEIGVNRHGIFGMIERARYLGGSMEIGRKDGKGTAAHLRLPLVVAKPKNRKRVLVADDHAIVRYALRNLLNSQTDDFSVEGEANDGEGAVQMALEGTWDIMLLDITLPKKNGLRVLEEIMATKPNFPIIMLSSNSAEEYGEIAISTGATGYVEKGETDKLVEAMRCATLLH